MPKKQNLTIGQIASRTGLAVSAIRYYESQGLVSPGRNSGGQRRFFRADIRKLSFVLIAQQFGFSIDQIREQLAALPDGRAPNKRDWAKISSRFRKQLDIKIKTLVHLRDKLDQCIGCGCLSLSNCALYNPDDRATKFGTGPRYLLGDAPENLAKHHPTTT